MPTSEGPFPPGMLAWLGIAGVIACVAFAITWALSVRIRNYGLLDVAFALGVAILAPLYALASPGAGLRKWIFTAIGVVWSIRLGVYILLRVLRHHPLEDPRYRTLRERWPSPLHFLGFFQLQAMLVVFFSVPFLITAWNTEPGVTALEAAGLLLTTLAVCGEALADWQMQRFKRRATPEAVCDVGLWRYSRHPNYFFESLVWWGCFLVALPAPWGWVTLACPLLMLYFLFRVTGIPLTEAHALERKGAAYREYQRTTSAFVPWFRRA